MKGFVSTLTFILYVSSLCRAQLTLQDCGDADVDVTCSFFFGEINDAFQDDTVLYTLRQSFFPTEGVPPGLLNVFMTINVENVPNITCKDPEFVFGSRSTSDPPTLRDVCGNNGSSGMYTCGPRQWSWEHQWSKTIINFIIEREDLDLLQDTNFIAFAASTFNSFDTSVFSDQDMVDLDNSDETNNSLASAGEGTITFFLTIDFLPCRPDDQVLLSAWEDILPWIELYAKNSDNLQNVKYNQRERGFAFRERASRNKGLTLPLLTVIHVLINAVFALVITYLLSKYHKDLSQVKGKQYQVVTSIYWSVVFLCFIGATVIIAGNVYLYYALILFDEGSREAFGFRLTNDITVAILVLIELIVSIFTALDPNFFIPLLIRRILCCNQCCSCCGSQTGRRFIRRVILSIAMWIIILLLQLVMSSLLPFAIVAVRNPVPSLAFLSIMVAMFFCLVVFVAYFLNAFEGNYIATHKLSKQERRRSSMSLETLRRSPSVASDWARNKLVLIAQAFIFLVIFGIVSLAIIIYLNFVRAGANANSVSGLFFSLFPSAALGGITWFAKRHLFQEFEEEVEETEDTSEEVEESLIKIGQFSIGSKRSRSFLRKLKDKKDTNLPAQLPPESSREHSVEDKDQLSPTTMEIGMPRPDSNTENGSSDRREEDKELFKRPEEDEEESIEVERNGDAAIDVDTPPAKENNDFSGVGTPQTKHISFAVDEHNVCQVPNSSRE